MAAPVEDLNGWRATNSTVVIPENKETGYAIADDHPGAVVLNGHGFSIVNYARTIWVRTRTVEHGQGQPDREDFVATAAKILVVGGIGNLIFGLITGAFMVRVRIASPEVPRYLTLTHLGALMWAPILLGLVWA